VLQRHKLITSNFSRHSIAEEVIAGIDLSGQRAIITGATSGIGVETARVLALAGAEVTLAVRNTKAGRAVAESIHDSTGNSAVRVESLELDHRDSVTSFVERWQGPLHLLINNAGVMAEPLSRTAEGWEHQFATNYLGHFALALGLHPALAAGAPARIVALSSSAHFSSPVDLDDLNFERRPYDPQVAYGQAKTAIVLFTVEATRRWAAEGITANAVMPGGIRTKLQQHQSGPAWEAIERSYDWKTVEEGAATTIFVATSPLLDGIGGRYFENCQEAEIVDPQTGYERQLGVAAYAVDPDIARQLWELSVGMLHR
jgi:NAD(P)-dependent dehydrogenase (short-subunit alcohol dehydrogenase family)